MQVAVVGNPNCGKSTLFNALSGARAKVGNYPGVTVQRSEAALRLADGETIRLVDLPGCYSLTARSAEEEIAYQVLTGHGAPAPDGVACVVDATQLARGLYLVLQLKELGLPVVVVLSMMDTARQRQMGIDCAALAACLELPVVPVCARRAEGLEPLRHSLQTMLRGAQTSSPLSRDARLAHLQLDPVSRAAVDGLSQVLGLPAQQPGAALRLLCARPGEAEEAPAASPAQQAGVAAALHALDPLGAGNFGRRLIAARYAWIDATLQRVQQLHAARADTTTQRWDKLLLHPVGGPALFALVMFGLFQSVFVLAQPLMAGVEALVGSLAGMLATTVPAGLSRDLLLDGLCAGVGTALTFVPQIALLICGMTLLEHSGYMARAAFLADALMRRVGLHGKAFIPLLSSFACAIPGILATRTIESRRDRLVTILVAPFMSCAARLPVYTLVVAAVLGDLPPLAGFISVGGLAIFLMYALGFAAAIGTAWLLKSSVLRAPAPPFVLDLPPLRRPALLPLVQTVARQCGQFIRQTGTVIVALSVLLWGVLNVPRHEMAAPEQPPGVQATAQGRAAQLEYSLGGRMGHALEPVLAPLGFDWRIGIALVASFAAREVLVSALAQVYALDSGPGGEMPALSQALRNQRDAHTGRPRFTPLVGLSLMVFFVLAMQCLSTVATVYRETGSWRWPLAQLVYMNGLAYLVSLAVFQGGRALGWS